VFPPELRDLRTYFIVDDGEFRAVDGVSFTLYLTARSAWSASPAAARA
jgi:ABC-type dipeptide/oligopeptide/nickel transport system ATPase component